MTGVQTCALPIYPADPEFADNKGNVSVTIGGANSVGQAPVEKNTVVMPIDTDTPWIQVNQNAFRVNRIEIENINITFNDERKISNCDYENKTTEKFEFDIADITYILELQKKNMKLFNNKINKFFHKIVKQIIIKNKNIKKCIVIDT